MDQKYLDFAEHIVAMSEAHQGLQLMGTMLAEGSVFGPGEGKAYQLMANLLGFLRLYPRINHKRPLDAMNAVLVTLRHFCALKVLHANHRTTTICPIDTESQ